MWVNQSFDGGRLDDETFLYFSDRLDTGWTAHPRNPVVSDARWARPAGRPFLHGGVVIRPAQDCTGGYGSRVVFNAVEVLTPDDYQERPVGSLEPNWAAGRNLGAHTYTFDGGSGGDRLSAPGLEAAAVSAGADHLLGRGPVISRDASPDRQAIVVSFAELPATPISPRIQRTAHLTAALEREFEFGVARVPEHPGRAAHQAANHCREVSLARLSVRWCSTTSKSRHEW